MSEVTPKKAQQFLELLKKDIAKTDQLMQYLEAEKKAIEDRDYDNYNKLLEHKKHLLIEVESLDHERQKIMQEMGFSSDKEGFNRFLAQVPSTWKSRFEDLWSTLTDKLNRCRDLNQVNGKILLHAQIATERLMQMMKGVSPNETIYHANGRTTAGASQRCLATA